MRAHQDTDNGPDLSLGIPVSHIPAGGLLTVHIAVRRGAARRGAGD
jgi:hypothetical protein